ncbi:preprotein translocase subunit SecG [Luteimonas sp. e5]
MSLLWALNILYVLLALAMIILILMQRGAGAQAGSGFGGGASGTVFGARGASNFLSKSTKWLAIAFFVLSIGMAWMHMRAASNAQQGVDLGVMAGAADAQPQVPAAPAVPEIPSAPAAQPVPSMAPAEPQAAPQAGQEER